MPLQSKISPENLKLRIADRKKEIPSPDNPDGSFNLDGYRYKPGEYDRFTSWWTFKGDSEHEAREQYLKPYLRGTFLDIGALCGAWTLPALKMGAEVISVEPDIHFYTILTDNVILNGFKKWRGLNCGVYDKDMTADFYDMSHIQLQRLDSLDLDKVNYIKIDVEGAELEVLNGGRELLSNNHPYLFIECHNEVTPTMIRDRLYELVGPVYSCKVIPSVPHIFARPI